ncbi:hypothetical protein AU255_01660 [Methyloprofundus sedimenti]|uniref:YecA family protein n=1 Tax=Methyloprofundus sedimenti TaxID=1420851 RepID=A0A1V8M4Z8_9GAMM|nr:UPF0149 family protein [Methyloprofundus sedimenti]OQK16637.1 hypothetical protein AU255_01660 [Methyloprofundus sedimenti]
MSYSDLNSIILQKDAADSAAEVHGIAVAMLCLNKNTEASDWINEAFSEGPSILQDDKVDLNDLFEQTKELMESDEFVFDLFLPAEDETVALRCTALMQWCQGFLFGMGRVQSNSEWPGEVDEVLKDIIEFTKLDTDIDEDDIEETENAFVEIQEYLRAAVMLIRSELNPVIEKSVLH